MEISLITSKIHLIRNQKVMLDFDLANLYGVETKQLKRSVKRNIDRFEGEDFMFEMTADEVSRCQIGTLNRGGNIKYLPFAFTELGVAMLSGILNSKEAIEVNRQIMRAFVAMRQYLLNAPSDNVAKLQSEVKQLKVYIEDVFTDYNEINEDTRLQLELINQTLALLQTKHKESDKPRQPIGFNAERYKDTPSD
jgi:hypothetical protein